MGGYESDVPSHALSTVELWRSVSDTVTVPGKFAVGPRTEDFLAQFVGPVVLTTRLRSNYADMVVIGDAGDSEQRSAGLERFESEFARYRADRDLVAAAVGSNVCADPTVFKVFCSRGRVLAILADRRLADMRQVQLFGRDFNHPRKLRLRGGSAHRRVVAGLQPPEPEAVLSPARKVSCQLDTAFARIDFIWSDGGPILLGVQLVPSDFMPHDSLVAPPSLLRDLAEAWAVAGDSRSFTLVRPAAKFDPRPWDAQHLTDENGA